MDRPGEEFDGEVSGSEVIHQPPTANPGRTQVRPADLDNQRDDPAGALAEPPPWEEER